jgi:hypothetical protein
MNFSYPCFPAVPQTRYPIQRRCKRVAALRESAQITAWNFLCDLCVPRELRVKYFLFGCPGSR